MEVYFHEAKSRVFPFFNRRLIFSFIIPFMDVQQLISKVKRKIIKLRLRPIRVFCCHEVSDYFDAKTTWEGDWISTEDFKKRIDCLKSKYVFCL